MNNQKSNWQSLKLSNVTEYVNRGVPPVYTQDNAGTAVINQKCIRDGLVNLDYCRLTDEAARSVPLEKIIQPFDILVNSTGTGTVGRVGQVFDLTQRTTVDTHVTIVRPNKNVVDPLYLGNWLKTKQDELEGLAGGSTNQVELSRAKIAELDVVLPPIDIQKKISSIVSSLDILISKTTQVIHKMDDLKQGLMRELFTKGLRHSNFKKTKIGDIPVDWEIVTLGSYADVSTGTTPSTSKPHYYSGDNIFIKTTEISNNRISKGSVFLSNEAVKKYRLKLYPPGTVLLAMYGQGKTRGQTALLDVAATTSQNAAAIVPNDKLDSEFLWYYLLSQYLSLRNSGTQGHISHLNLGYVKDVLVPLPSKNEQKEIAQILKSVTARYKFEEKSKKQLLILKKGLLHDIFTRKVEVN